MEDRLGKIKFYFNLGLRYNEIVFVLQFIHGYSLSKRHLIRILHKEGLYRHKNPTDIMDVLEFIKEEQRKSGVLHGYRWMYQKCKEKGINALKEKVRLLMRVLDPESVELRKAHRLRRRKYMSKGPNYIWHLDSYDKLRPFGICINGCVDGFSRKIMWLNAYYTNSHPKVKGGYFLETIQSLGGCPIIVRGDKGTENPHVCTFQRFFRRNGDDNFFCDKSFMYGCSTSNQRIEYWWGFLRKECIEFWLALFDQLKAADLDETA
ncbi:hypothetical protein KUTeg_006825 [Tegillarca granosa]|uniref:Integrase core domain-containing protein n=1 Tax=Tegillarca granosa TaxID=220873 RepID=A0ABQ9FBF8_TEGGR|nr:hypothetical protein KUTeg_006825 [Tegillarca granosa]